jgi:Niemann-Pick C1 protein
MDLIGGGAQNYSTFFKFMGDEKDLGSPFQINFPNEAPQDMTPFDKTARNCYDDGLESRCTCIDCPDVCRALPEVPSPGSGQKCHVGALSCLSFILILVYGLAVASFLTGFSLHRTIRRRKERYGRIALSADGTSDSTPLSPRSRSRGLVGTPSLARAAGDESPGNYSESRRLGRGASLLDPIGTVQPRQYKLNTILRRFFFRMGLRIATSPWLTFAIMFTAVGLLNLGWRNFAVETDPVRLWVAPDSESKIQKEYFDEHFGPFFRPEQIFVTSTPTASTEPTTDIIPLHSKSPVLSWEHLKYWFDIEAEIRELTSEPNGYTLSDVCFKPAGPDGFCVVQSIGGWFNNDLSMYDPKTWRDHVLRCARSPVECRPDFEQPLSPQYILGGVPVSEDGGKQYLDAQALVVTYVVSDSLNPEDQAKAMEWERTLRAYLQDLSARIGEEAGLEISFSTGVSLEEELNKSTNMDIKIVVLSYLAMFFYVSLTLGNGYVGKEEDGLFTALFRWARNFPRLFSPASSSTVSIDSRNNPTFFPRIPRKLYIGSKVMLGLFGISLVILSVCSSVGFFSIMNVRATLIIAEVIPFLVLAVGVDNVFILVHELDRQNLAHGPNAPRTLNYSSTTPLSPTQSRNRGFDPSQSNDDTVDAASIPNLLSVEERVARTLAKMGPSILLSTITEVVAFALGAIVPMPAVRNFALYAAGSVFLNALLQVTVFVSALTLDQRRQEVSVENNLLMNAQLICMPRQIVSTVSHASASRHVLH